MKEPAGQLGGEAPSPQVHPEATMWPKEPKESWPRHIHDGLAECRAPGSSPSHYLALLSLQDQFLGRDQASVLYPDHALNPSLGDSGEQGLHPCFTSQSSLFILKWGLSKLPRVALNLRPPTLVFCIAAGLVLVSGYSVHMMLSLAARAQ